METSDVKSPFDGFGHLDRAAKPIETQTLHRIDMSTVRLVAKARFVSTMSRTHLVMGGVWRVPAQRTG